VVLIRRSLPELGNVLVESAFFDPVTIRRGSKRLGISSEASYRFERGADIGGATSALKRAVSLICRLAGGKVAKGIIDVYPKTFTPTCYSFPERQDESNFGHLHFKGCHEGVF